MPRRQRIAPVPGLALVHREMAIFGELERRILDVMSDGVPRSYAGIAKAIPDRAYTTVATTVNRLYLKRLLVADHRSPPRYRSRVRLIDGANTTATLTAAIDALIALYGATAVVEAATEAVEQLAAQVSS